MSGSRYLWSRGRSGIDKVSPTSILKGPDLRSFLVNPDAHFFVVDFSASIRRRKDSRGNWRRVWRLVAAVYPADQGKPDAKRRNKNKCAANAQIARHSFNLDS